MSRAASIAGFEDPLGDDNDCGICLEADLDVAINGCKHRLCIDCSIRSGCLEALCLFLGAVLLHAWHAVCAHGDHWDALGRMSLIGNIIRMQTYASVLRALAALHALHTSSANNDQGLCHCRLCEVTKKPPLCPFCRNFIEGFHALQLAD